MTMILTNVTMVGWADVQDCDWGDFRRWHAVDISSSNSFLVKIINPIAFLTPSKFTKLKMAVCK